MATILERLEIRLGNDYDEAIVSEMAQTIEDRLVLRLRATHLPEVFQSVVVDATVKMFRRVYYEGISSEGAANINTSFVEDILAEYDDEITSWQAANASSDTGMRVVRFK